MEILRLKLQAKVKIYFCRDMANAENRHLKFLADAQSFFQTHLDGLPNLSWWESTAVHN